MRRRLSPSIRLAFYYFAFSVAWILIGGKITDWLAGGNTDKQREIEDFKGLFFVLISALFIYSISRSLYKQLVNTLNEKNELLKKYQAVMLAAKEGIYEYDLRN